jgi:hypothetical protein
MLVCLAQHNNTSIISNQLKANRHTCTESRELNASASPGVRSNLGAANIQRLASKRKACPRPSHHYQKLRWFYQYASQPRPPSYSIGLYRFPKRYRQTPSYFPQTKDHHPLTRSPGLARPIKLRVRPPPCKMPRHHTTPTQFCRHDIIHRCRPRHVSQSCNYSLGGPLTCVRARLARVP